VALPAFARRTLLLSAGRAAINQSLPAYNSKPAAAGLLLWAHAGTDGQRDGRTPYRT